MAAIFVMAGGMIGFISAVVSLIMLKTSVLMALAIWSGVGLLAVIVALAFVLAPRRISRQRAEAQSI
jgi:hypothetical protein